MLNENPRRRQLCLCFCTVLAAVLLWRWQRIFWLECADYIRADMVGHVALALGRHDYSLSSVIIRILWSLFDEDRACTLLSLILTFNQAAGVLTLWLLLRGVLPELDGVSALLAALLANICGPWIFPGQTGMYLGVYNGNVWHNMTVLFSRTWIPPALLCFWRLWEARRETLSARDWLGFLFFLLLGTLFKPSFFGAFAPAALALLLWDFVKTRGQGLKNEFLIGLAVLPAAGALIWSSLVLFSDDFAGTQSSVALRALTPALLCSTLLMFLRGLLLPLWTGILQGPKEARRERLGILAGINAVAMVEALLLTETGFRGNDGNFDWGYISLYPSVFALAIGLLMRMLPAARTDRRARLCAIVGLVLLLGHLIIGVYCLSRPGSAGYDWFYF